MNPVGTTDKNYSQTKECGNYDNSVKICCRGELYLKLTFAKCCGRHHYVESKQLYCLNNELISSF